DEYQKLNPNIKINYSQKNFDDNLSRYKSTLYLRLKDGSGPEIFKIHSTWTPMFLQQLSIAVGDISDIISYRKRFYPVVEDQCVTTSAQVYCVPLMYDGLTLLYNKNMFDAEGLKPPSTWEEVRIAALKLVRYENGQISRGGIAIGTGQNVSNSSDILGLMLNQSGVEIPDALDTDAAAIALSYYRNFAIKDKVWNSTTQNSILAFATEKTAMAFATSDQIRKILEINPTLQFISAPVPQLPNLSGGTTNNEWATFWVEAVNADIPEDKQKASWEFINWMSKPEQQAKLFVEKSKLQKFGNIYSDKTLEDNLFGSKYLKAILDGAPNAKTSIIADNVGNDEYSSIIKSAIDSPAESSAALKVAKAELLKLN
ncbi:hypothetical protein CO178_01465, partial [candidate division WWE3 bacterium CG_4_9_14_3_um_filter_34_6]